MTSVVRGHDAWGDAERVLCVRLDALGDVLMTGPAIRALRAARPGRRMSLLTSPAGAAAAELLPGVDEVLVHDAPWVKAHEPRRDGARERALVERLRAGRFDAAAIFTVYTQSALPAALLCQLADVPLRLAHAREKAYGLLTDWVPDPEPERGVRHEVRRQLDLVAAVGCAPAGERMAVELPERARAGALAALAAAGIDPAAPWALVHPGASAPSRRYPPELLARAVRLLAEDGRQVVLAGGPGAEEALAERVLADSGAPGVSLAGRLDVAELAALIAEAPVLVANNSAPMHLAAAVGTPVVALYALTNPQHAPWMVPARVLYEDVPCRDCRASVCPEGHHRCLAGVAPEAVAAAVRDVSGAMQATTRVLAHATGTTGAR